MKPKISIILPVGPNRKMEALDYLKKQSIPIQIIIEEGTNPSRNRNLGVEKAESSIIAFIDAHSLLPEDWSKKVISFFEQHKEIDIVGGPQLTPEEENYVGQISGYALSSIFGAADVSTRYKPKKLTFNANEKLLTSSNLACRSKVLKRIKFDESLWPGEDPKFIEDAKKEGLKIAYNPDIFIYHRRRSTIRDFAQQIFNYGKMRPYKESLIRTMKKPFFLAPSFFVIYLAMFTLGSSIHFIFLIPLLIYVILLVLFSLYESIKNSNAHIFFIIPFMFFTIHITYGLGFIYGTLSKIFK